MIAILFIVLFIRNLCTSEYIDGDRGRLDPVQYILGKRWQYLRAGDKVLVNFIHTPTGRVIFSKEVVVTG